MISLLKYGFLFKVEKFLGITKLDVKLVAFSVSGAWVSFLDLNNFRKSFEVNFDLINLLFFGNSDYSSQGYLREILL